MRFAVLAGYFLAAFFAAQATASTAVSHADVLREVHSVHASIESIRMRLGVSGVRNAAFDVKNASTYEVYFQALALFQKSNWLAREFGRKLSSPPPLNVPLQAVEPGHVLAVIQATHNNLRPFQARLGIAPEPGPAPVSNPGATPTDVYRAILDANQGLNLLLRIRIQPRDVYRTVSLTTDYVDKIIARLALNTPLPQTERHFHKLSPDDVFNSLVSTYATIAKLISSSGQQALQLKVHAGTRSQIYPGHNYDLASLLLSEVAYLYALTNNDPPPPLPPDRSEISVTDVYEQTNLLNHRLTLLLNFAQHHPDWPNTPTER